MKTWTIDEMLAEGPCSAYTRERLTALWAGRERLTLADILDLDIPAADRVWVACKPGAMPQSVRDEWIEGVVRRAIQQHAVHCGMAEVESWAARWLSGADRSAEAAWAARAAAWASWAADAAEAAAEANAARAAERERQVGDLRSILCD